MKKAGELVQGFFETYGIRDDKNYAGFMAAWTDIIGERLATHSRPSDIKGQVLIVAVDHPGWMTHIRMAEREVIRKIQKRFPQLGIITVAFQLVDKLPTPSRSRQAIEQAEKPVDKMPGTNAEVDAASSVDEPENQIQPTETDRSTLFTALDRLKAAMEKRNP